MKTGEAFQAVVDVMHRLRAPDGCPWDRVQTPEALKTYLVEEAYEVIEAIDQKDPAKLREELGDLLLQVVFLSEIAAEEGRFDIAEVCTELHEKLVRRHPHVFGEHKASDPEEALGRWEARKRKEGRGVLAGVPASLPALLMALRVSEKVRSVGFDWPDASGAVAKLDEEVAELKAAIAAGDRARIEAELGDVLFTVANLARIHRIDPEDSLRNMLARFRRRFEYIEARLAAEGKPVAGQTLATLDALWEAAKDEGL